jgi:hypothetical protein
MKISAHRLFFTVVLIGAFATSAGAQSRLKDEAAVRKLSDDVMKKLSSGDLEAGLRLAKPYLVIPDAEFEAMLGQAKLQSPAMSQRFGRNVGYEFVREEKAGTVWIRIVQLNLYEKHSTRWNFYFYRTSTGWVLNSFNFDDNIRALFSN